MATDKVKPKPKVFKPKYVVNDQIGEFDLFVGGRIFYPGDKITRRIDPVKEKQFLKGGIIKEIE